MKYYNWWITTRDPRNLGLVAVIHSWESGMDASPAYDEAYFLKNPQPQLLDLYPKFIELVFAYQDLYGWNIDEILNRNGTWNGLWDHFFVVYDTGVNSVLARSFAILSELGFSFFLSILFYY